MVSLTTTQIIPQGQPKDLFFHLVWWYFRVVFRNEIKLRWVHFCCSLQLNRLLDRLWFISTMICEMSKRKSEAVSIASHWTITRSCIQCIRQSYGVYCSLALFFGCCCFSFIFSHAFSRLYWHIRIYIVECYRVHISSSLNRSFQWSTFYL